MKIPIFREVEEAYKTHIKDVVRGGKNKF